MMTTTARSTPAAIIPDSVPEACRGVPFMTSLEIAGMTGKRHDNVMRDIERELAAIGVGLLKFEGCYLDGNGRRRPCYALPGKYLLFIASAYDAKLRMQIIEHWEALNNGTAKPVKDAANIYVGTLVARSRAEKRARIEADVAQFVERNGREPTSKERFWIEKP